MTVAIVTGGIGSGKSEVLRRLSALGAEVIEADVIAKELYNPGGPAYREVLEAFGKEVLKEDGSVDHERLARIVFSDTEKLKRLNAITHPRVIAEIASRAKRAQEQGRVAVVEIPLLSEVLKKKEDLKALPFKVDAVIVVVAPEEVRIERLKKRGLSEEQARARMKRQASDEERLKLADFVIDNSGDLEALEKQVEKVGAELGLIPT